MTHSCMILIIFVALGLSGGEIAGIVIGILAAIGIIGSCVNYAIKKPAHSALAKKDTTFDDEDDNM